MIEENLRGVGCVDRQTDRQVGMQEGKQVDRLACFRKYKEINSLGKANDG